MAARRRGQAPASSPRPYLVTAVAGVLLACSVVVAAFALPSTVHSYFGPASSADSELPKALFLLLTTAGAVAAAVGVAIVAGAFGRVVAAFEETPAAGAVKVRRLVDFAASWPLFVGVAGLWLAIALGNDRPELRSTLESVVALVAVSGTVATVLIVSFAPSRKRK